jgi:hypothetical protein
VKAHYNLPLGEGLLEPDPPILYIHLSGGIKKGEHQTTVAGNRGKPRKVILRRTRVEYVNYLIFILSILSERLKEGANGA